MNDKKRKKINLKILISSLISLTGVLAIIWTYSKIQESVISDQIESSVCQSTDQVAATIDSSVGFALNSIQVTANAVSGSMNSSELQDPQRVLSEFIDSTPFSSIEYIRADGMNMTNAGDPFDASDREYYKRGIAGETGIWINYHPKYSKEPLLDFYSPLIYNGRIAGVLVGVMGGNTTISPLLLSKLFNQDVSGILLDSDNNIIAASESFEPGLVLNRDTAQISDDNMQKFLDAVDNADGTALILYGKAGRLTASVSQIGSADWKVIHILDGKHYNNIMKRTRSSSWLAVCSSLAISVFLFLVLFSETKKFSKARILIANSERDEMISILSSMSGIYYSMHIVDLKENKAVEYTASNEVKDVFSKYYHDNAVEIMQKVMEITMTDNYLKRGLEFTDLNTVSDRLKGKKFISMDLEGRNVGWIRFSFISIDEDENGIPLRVVCTTQIIEEDKQREERLIIQSNTDEMTGFRNRRSYEDDVAVFPDYPPEPDFVYVSIDVNELKVVNDNLGHNAGDELIKGAAECLKQCLGNYGRLYRTGGDEFAAIIFADHDRLEKIKDDLERTTIEWKGKLVDKLSLSCGFVERNEYPDTTVAEIAKIADKRMYEAKSDHYRKKGVDRRGQSAAHSALCTLYTKILKINLTDDTYQIVNMYNDEKNESMGFSDKISVWLSQFGKTGQVHPDDLAEYLSRTNINYLSQYFKEDKTSISIQYRRKYGTTYKCVVMDMIPANDYTQDNQTLFLYVKTIEK